MGMVVVVVAAAAVVVVVVVVVFLTCEDLGKSLSISFLPALFLCIKRR